VITPTRTATLELVGFTRQSNGLFLLEAKSPAGERISYQTRAGEVVGYWDYLVTDTTTGSEWGCVVVKGKHAMLFCASIIDRTLWERVQARG
jgi:hypothetical protein